MRNKIDEVVLSKELSKTQKQAFYVLSKVYIGKVTAEKEYLGMPAKLPKMKLSLLSSLREKYKQIDFEEKDYSCVVNLEDEVREIMPIGYIKLIKLLCAESVTASNVYRGVIADVTKYLVNSRKHLCIPMEIDAGKNKLRKVLLEEFNDFVKEVFDAENIKYSAVIKSSGKKELLDSASKF